MMRPKTTKKDLPSTHDLSVYIHNRFVDQLKLLKKDIAVRTHDANDTEVLLTNPVRMHLVQSQPRPMDGLQITPRGHSLG